MRKEERGTLQSMHERMNEIENRLAKVADRLGF
jgi:archaellum component FlaC